MKQEIEDANFGSDAWLRQCVEMEGEEVKAEEFCNESFENTESKFSIKWEKVEQERGQPFENHSQFRQWSKKQQETAQNKAKLKKRGSCKKIVKETSSESTKVLSSFVEEAPISNTRTSGMCTFKCSDCPNTYHGWGAFYRHMKLQHDKNIKMSENEMYLTKVFVYICKICSEKVLCDSAFIFLHLRRRHKIRMSAYREKFNLKKETTSVLVANAPVSETAAPGMCTFKCPECNSQHANYNRFSLHMRYQHETSVKMVESETYLSKVMVHVCKICSSRILSDSIFMSDHFNQKHKLTLQEYRLKYIEGKVSNDLVESREELVENVKYGHNNISQIYYNKVLEASKRQEAIAQNIKKTYYSQANKGENNNVTARKFVSILDKAPLSENATAGLCLFKCLQCTFQNTTWMYFTQHMRKVHQKAVKMSEYEKFASKAFVHVCKVCSDKVLCDSVHFSKHFRQHGLSIKEYRQKYFDKCKTKEAWKAKLEEIMQKGTLYVIKIGNLCSFKCSKCAKVFKSITVLRKHCRDTKCHVYNNDCLYKYLDKVVTHKCKLCSKLLLCDWGIIHSHIKTHRIKTLQEYAENTGCVVVGDRKERETIVKNYSTLGFGP